MAITWILVANASLARLYAYLGPKEGLQLVKEIAHPESRMKNADLSSDRASQMHAGGHGVGDQHSRPKLNAARNFAHKLARELYLGRSRNLFARAILVAPPAFMGMLNATLDGPTAQRVMKRLEKDYTKSSEPSLASQLESCMHG